MELACNIKLTPSLTALLILFILNLNDDNCA